MRLLDARTKNLVNFYDDAIPPYAILSHRWRDTEVTLQDFEKWAQNGSWNNKDLSVSKFTQSLEKIEWCCEQALKDNMTWVWIDTCCIDKTNNAELSEAINSMFQWYKRATVCYAYLCDVPDDDDIETASSVFCKSMWFTRGWTLQELLAPKDVRFFGNAWGPLGNRDTLCQPLHTATGIPTDVLRGSPIHETSIAQRMSWASTRRTSRKEDMAYCLLGIFDVNMPLLYGEGDKAFFRLQEAIIKTSTDDSIFAWGLDSARLNAQDGFGVLARSPQDFEGSSSVVQCRLIPRKGKTNFQLTKEGVRMMIQMSLGTPPGLQGKLKNSRRRHFRIGVLNCRLAHDNENILTIPLFPAHLVTPSAIWEAESYMTRPRDISILPLEEHLSYYWPTESIFVADGSGVAQEGCPRGAIIHYNVRALHVTPNCGESALRPLAQTSDSLSLPMDSPPGQQQDESVFDDMCVIIAPPTGYYRWNVRLLYQDSLFEVYIGSQKSNQPLQGLGLGGLCSTRHTYLLYEAESHGQQGPVRFALKFTASSPWPYREILYLLPIFQWLPLQSIWGLSCTVARVDVIDVQQLYHLGYLTQLSWKSSINIGRRSLGINFRLENDSVRILLRLKGSFLLVNLLRRLLENVARANSNSALSILDYLASLFLCIAVILGNQGWCYINYLSICLVLASSLLALSLKDRVYVHDHLSLTQLALSVFKFLYPWTAIILTLGK